MDTRQSDRAASSEVELKENGAPASDHAPEKEGHEAEEDVRGSSDATHPGGAKDSGHDDHGNQQQSSSHSSKQNHHHGHHHGHHHHKEPIFVPHSSRLCCYFGPRDKRCRLCLFEFVEARWFQYLMLALLVVDVIVVGLEIAVTYRIIKPEHDLDQQSLGIPKEMVCASPLEVEYKYGWPVGESDPGTLEDCCHDFADEYPFTDIWETGVVGDDAEGVNVAACMLGTNWTGLAGPPKGMKSGLVDVAGDSTANEPEGHHRYLSSIIRSSRSRGIGSQRRMLLSSTSSGHGPPPPRCFDYPNHKYRPPPVHLPLQDLMHWISNIILFVFLLELFVILYAMRAKQFCCACKYTVHEDDLIVVVDRDTGKVKCPHALVTHVNYHTGKACLKPLKHEDIDHSSGTATEGAKNRTKNRLRQVTASASAKKLKRPSISRRNLESTRSKWNTDANTVITLPTLSSSDTYKEEKTLKDIPYWEMEHFSAPYKGTSRASCGRFSRCYHSTRGCESPCTWFNSFFVLDLIIVTAAILLENMTQILERLEVSCLKFKLFKIVFSSSISNLSVGSLF